METARSNGFVRVTFGSAPVAPGGIATASGADLISDTPHDCKTPDAPYKDYDCLDKYLGDGFFERLVNYYRVEWGHEAPPVDPKAPPGRRDHWPTTPQSTPPYPFTEWPYGGATALGVTRPSSVDSPLIVALANTGLGKAMKASASNRRGNMPHGVTPRVRC